MAESPAEIVFGHPIRDSLPRIPIRNSWADQSHYKELGMAKLRVANKEKLDKKARNLEPLTVGDHVQVQNQVSPKPTRWDKSGTVIETHGNHQYSMRMEGS